jgi:hypothetical protein
MTQRCANLDSLRKGLRDLGYIEGQNLIIEYRSADGRAERSQNSPPNWSSKTRSDFGAQLGMAARQNVDALVVGADGLTQAHQQMIVNLMANYKLPAAYPAREFVEAGGLVAYAVNYPDLDYRFAAFIDRIFKGTKPEDLPIEQPTRFIVVPDSRPGVDTDQSNT